ncbi:hypothetical protein CWD92_22080, partial [Burkholderia thailandensis]
TRCAFEVAAYDQGANVTYIDPASSQIGHKESMKPRHRPHSLVLGAHPPAFGTIHAFPPTRVTA